MKAVRNETTMMMMRGRVASFLLKRKSYRSRMRMSAKSLSTNCFEMSRWMDEMMNYWSSMKNRMKNLKSLMNC